MKNLTKCPHCGAENKIQRVEDVTNRQHWTGEMDDEGDWEDDECISENAVWSETIRYECASCQEEVEWDDDEGFVKNTP